MSLIKTLIHRPHLVIIGILVLASFLRLYRLDQVPPSPYWEEVALGYDAYSISQTGKDHQGNAYPILAFPSFGDYKPSGYFYATVPFVKVLGLNIWAVRLPSSLSGIASVYLVYRIGKQLFDQKTGLVSSFLFAIQPWAIQFSRGGWEVNLSLFLLLLGAWFLICAKTRPWHLLGTVIAWGLSMYTYHAARLFVPLMGGVAGLWLTARWICYSSDSSSPFRIRAIKLTRTQGLSLLFALLLGLIFISPFILNLKNKQVSSRFSDTSIFSQLQPILDSNAAIAASGNTSWAKLVYHRYWYFGKIFVVQWASHYSPQFLFVSGDGNFRHGGWTGLLYPVEAIFISVSFWIVVDSFRKRSKIHYPLLFFFFWLFLAALPAALVTPAPHALRFLYAAPIFSLLSAVGLLKLAQIVWERIRSKNTVRGLYIGLTITIIYFFATYISQYFVVYSVISASDWQYGYKQLYEGLAKYKKEGEQVYVSREQGRPAMYYLFYSQFDPKTLQDMGPSQPKDQLELLQVGDYSFVDMIPTAPGLYATSLSKRDPNSDLIGYIRRPDWSLVWAVWRR